MRDRLPGRLVSLCLAAGLMAAAWLHSIQPVSGGGLNGPVSIAGAAGDAVRVLESDERGVYLELTAPAFQVQAAVSDAGACSQVLIPGWDASAQEGQPALPGLGVLLAVPPGTLPRVTVIEAQSGPAVEGIDLCPAATRVGRQGEGLEAAERLIADPRAYGSDRDFPGDWVALGEPAQIRSQQVIPLRLQPFQYNPVTQTLTSAQTLRVRLEFDPPAAGLAAGRVDEGAYEGILKGLLVNYEAGRDWRLTAARQQSAWQIPQPAYKLEVTQDGMVRLDYAALQTAGLPVDSLDPLTLRLYNQGVEMALQVEGQADGSFDPGDFLVFYGQRNTSRFSDSNIYWLTWGGANGLRMAASGGQPLGAAVPAAFRATVRREENHFYMPVIPSGPEGDFWYWELVNTAAPLTKNYTIHLAQVSGAGGTARVRGLINGFAAVPHHATRVSLNGHLILDQTWPSTGELAFDLEVDQAYLLEGANTISVECPMTGGVIQDAFLVNWFEIEYTKTYQGGGGQVRFAGDAAGTWEFHLPGFESEDTRVWDISDPARPVAITNPLLTGSGPAYTLVFQQTLASARQYLAASPADLLAPARITPAQPNDLLAASNGADYLIISHPDFLGAVQPLADYHAAHGLRVRLVNVLDIYDAFSAGLYDPGAITDFVAYAYSNWSPPAPAMVLLVGDGHYDYKNYLGLNEPNYIPPYLVNVDPWLGEVAADNRFVTVSGGDLLPDLAIGRLPVKSEAETTRVVNKILAYPGAQAGDWSGKTLFAAGKNDPSSGNYPALSDQVVNAFLASRGVTVERVYYGITHADGASSRAAILNAVNQGRAIVHYSGHSSPLGWYGDPNAPNTSSMFSTTTAGSLTNAGRLPFLVSMTCLVGDFNNPYIRPLDEILLTQAQGGTIASWSPAGKGLSAGHSLLDDGLFDALYRKNIHDLGWATLLAKYHLYASSSGFRDLLDTFGLLGDPAVRLPIDTRIYVPVVVR